MTKLEIKVFSLDYNNNIAVVIILMFDGILLRLDQTREKLAINLYSY